MTDFGGLEWVTCDMEGGQRPAKAKGRPSQGSNRAYTGSRYPFPPQTPLRLHRAIMKILFVDDYEDTAQALADLSEFMGHEAAIARTAAEAQEKTRLWIPDIVVMDIWLGTEDGRDVCRHLRRDPTLRQCRWVALTGSPTEQIPTEPGLFDEILMKPVAIDALERLFEKGCVDRPSA